MFSRTYTIYYRTFSTLLFVLLLLLFTGCGVGKGKVRIKGHFRQVDKAELYIYAENDDVQSIDTLRLDNGRFDVTLPINQTKVMTILFPNFQEMYVVVEDNATIDIEGQANNLAEVNVDGTESNKLLTKFRLQNVNKPKGDKLLAAADFIRSNASSMAATAVFMQYFVRNQTFPSQTLSLLNLLKKEQPKNLQLTKIDKNIRPILQTNAASRLPSFVTKDINGLALNAELLRGKPLVVYFFSQWESTCRLLYPQLRTLRRAYGSRLNLLGISLDYSAIDCRNIVKNDTLPGHIVCDGLAFDSPMIHTFGMSSLPGLILFNAQGRMVARDFDISELQQQTSKLF